MLKLTSQGRSSYLIHQAGAFVEMDLMIVIECRETSALLAAKSTAIIVRRMAREAN